MIARNNVVFKMAFWNKEIETMPREELEKMQLSLLRAKVRCARCTMRRPSSTRR